MRFSWRATSSATPRWDRQQSARRDVTGLSGRMILFDERRVHGNAPSSVSLLDQRTRATPRKAGRARAAPLPTSHPPHGRVQCHIMAETLTASVERVTHHSPETGFAVLRVIP